MKLTQTNVARFALTSGKQEEIVFDDDIPGFGLRARAGGSRTWIFQYKFGAKHRRMTLGAVSAVKPDKARQLAADLHAKVRLGHDPMADRVEARVRATETFKLVLDAFLARQRAKLKYRSRLEVERHLLVHAKALHDLPLAKIGRRTIATRLAEIAKSSGSVTANRVRASLSSFFAWAVREGITEANPVIDTNKAHERGARTRVLTDGEILEIWNALRDDHYGAIVKLLLLSGQRRDEIGSLRWSEVDFDREVISLPPERTKNHRPHDVPLSGLALTILKALPRRAGRDLVFGQGEGPYSGWSNSKAALNQRILEARKTAAKEGGNRDDKIEPIAPWRLHDLRRTCDTVMADRLGVLPHVIEAVLNHVSGHKAGVAGVYNRAEYMVQKRDALERWADHVRSILDGTARKIVSLRQAR